MTDLLLTTPIPDGEELCITLRREGDRYIATAARFDYASFKRVTAAGAGSHVDREEALRMALETL